MFCGQTSSGSTSNLIDDNERLGKENSQFNKELSEMRNLCNNINALISNYANKPAETGSQAVKLLDLLPLKRYNGGETSVHGSGSQSETEKSLRLKGRRRGSSGSFRVYGVLYGVFLLLLWLYYKMSVFFTLLYNLSVIIRPVQVAVA